MVFKQVFKQLNDCLNICWSLESKLGAPPQPVESLEVVRLECWNAGILEEWVLASGS